MGWLFENVHFRGICNGPKVKGKGKVVPVQAHRGLGG